MSGPADPAAAAADQSDSAKRIDDDVIEGSATRLDGDDVAPTDAQGAAQPDIDDTPDPVEGSTDSTEGAVAEPEDTPAPSEDRAPAAEKATPPPAPVPARRGGFLPLVFGGLVAAGIGYGASYMGWLPTGPDDSAQAEAIARAIEGQNAALAALQAQVAEIATSAPPAAPEIDLSPVLSRIEDLSSRLDSAVGGIATLGDRVTTLEDRPIFSGDIATDAAAALESAAALEAQLAAEREAAAAQAAELAAATAAAEQAAAQAAAEAQAAIAAAEAEAAAALDRAEAEAALGLVQAALATGQPFAEPLAAIAGAVDIPEGLAAVAETGVATPEALQEAFPPLARAALPLALQETAGEGMGDRALAFVIGQVGGRSVEPREGDDPDAVLSRIEAAVRMGDLSGALTEAEALPASAQTVLAPWLDDVAARAAAEDGLDAVIAALAATPN
jgi:hypothetical protein